MNTVELKSGLHKIIDSIEGNDKLKAVYAILSKLSIGKKEVDWWDQISEAEKQAIEEGLASIERGEVYTHEEVMKEIKTKFNL